jgi:hypothetical protein
LTNPGEVSESLNHFVRTAVRLIASFVNSLWKASIKNENKVKLSVLYEVDKGPLFHLFLLSRWRFHEISYVVDTVKNCVAVRIMHSCTAGDKNICALKNLLCYVLEDKWILSL